MNPKATHKQRVAIVTNIPAPYRVPVFERLSQSPEIELKVFYCSGREPDRFWDIGETRVSQHFLRERYVTVAGRYIHFNADVLGALSAFAPQVVITTGFNPTHLLAFAYARWHKLIHIPMTDGTLSSEAGLSLIHRWLRRRVFANSSAFIAASNGGFALYKSYGISPTAMFKSHLCVDNARFATMRQEKRFDFLFSGRFVAVKNPLFALSVAHETAIRLGRKVSILFLGAGELEARMRETAEAMKQLVDVKFGGYAKQSELPYYFGLARVFLFPTSWDPWGVVANEACAAGVPVLTTEHAGSAGEIVRPGENGEILPLNVVRWAGTAARLLTRPGEYRQMSARGQELVAEYSYANAAEGILKAVRYARESREAEKPVVVVMQRRLTHYRVPLFERLRQLLALRGVTLRVVVGRPTEDENRRQDSGYLDWAVAVKTRYFLGKLMCWQSAGDAVRDASLLVLPHENRLFFNHYALLVRRYCPVAFWGHGKNFQARTLQWSSEVLKRILARRSDWWFAYTDRSANTLRSIGVSQDIISVLNNACDTSDIEAVRGSDCADEIANLRRQLGLSDGPVGIMIASLHQEKRLEFLVSALERIRARVPDFQFLLVGDGPLADYVETSVQRLGPWFVWAGARLHREKALLLAMADVKLNPGMVGLGILDSFAAGVPMVTTDIPTHSPEIAYLESGYNGLITDNSEDAFVEGVVRVLQNDVLHRELRTGCLESAKRYTLEAMAQRFCDGICDALRHTSTNELRVATSV